MYDGVKNEVKIPSNKDLSFPHKIRMLIPKKKSSNFTQSSQRNLFLFKIFFFVAMAPQITRTYNDTTNNDDNQTKQSNFYTSYATKIKITFAKLEY